MASVEMKIPEETPLKATKASSEIAVEPDTATGGKKKRNKKK